MNYQSECTTSTVFTKWEMGRNRHIHCNVSYLDNLFPPRFPEADQIYQLGINRRAQPVERLQRHYHAFQKRMVLAGPNQNPDRTAQSSTVVPEATTSSQPRGILKPKASVLASTHRSASTSLTTVHDENDTVPTTTSLNRQPPKVRVYADSRSNPTSLANHVLPSGPWPDLGTTKSRAKENTVVPTPWAGKKIPQAKNKPSGRAFQVFKDEPESSQSSKPAPSKSPKKAASCPLSERSAPTVPPTKSQTAVPGKRPERTIANLDLLYVGQDEFSFEETRAKKYYDNTDDYMIDHENEEAMNPGDAVKNRKRAPLSEGSRTNASKDGQKAKSDAKKLAIYQDPPKRSSSVASPTINTKAALADIIEMFNQPLPSAEEEDDEPPPEPTLPLVKPRKPQSSLKNMIFRDDADEIPVNTRSDSGSASRSRVPLGETSTKTPRVSRQVPAEQHEVATPYSASFDASFDGFKAKILHHERTNKEVIPPPSCSTASRSASTVLSESKQVPVQSTPHIRNSRTLPVDLMTPITEVSEEKSVLYRPSNSICSLSSISAKTLAGDSSNEFTLGSLGSLSPPADFRISRIYADDAEDIVRFDGSPRGEEVLQDASNISVLPKDEDKKANDTVVRALEEMKIEENSKSRHRKESIVLDVPNPCKPLASDIVQLILSKIQPPLSMHPLYYDFSASTDEQHLNLSKTLKPPTFVPNLRRARQTSSTEIQISLGNHIYDVFQNLGEGGYGAVYQAKPYDEDSLEDEYTEPQSTVSSPNYIALKIQTPATQWEFFMLTQLQSRLSSKALQSIIQPNAFYDFSNVSYLSLEYVPSCTLLNAVNLFSSSSTVGTSQPQGLDELLVVFYTIELFKLVEELHCNRIIHGDLKPDNILLRSNASPPSSSSSSGPKSMANHEEWSSQYHPDGRHGWDRKGIKLIDWGRSIDLNFFPPGTKFLADWEPVDKIDCIEVMNGWEWRYEIDYWGCAVVIYAMLFGEYMDVVKVKSGDGVSSERKRPRYKLAQSFKRYWNVPLWKKVFEVLLNAPYVWDERWNQRGDAGDGVDLDVGEGVIADVMRELRIEMQEWLMMNCNKSGKSLKSLLRGLEGLR
ncbi:hypothetical protein BKA69DRAFT_799854 [Paraphysoderma sedebokerense]|nr:hypothetical protein BKA69DRAFT_799854 [Paraphysoderma sedebokerense]